MIQQSPEVRIKQIRAGAALRAALYQEPLNADMLRIAVKQAQEAGVQSPDLQRAQALLAKEEGKQEVLMELRQCLASKDLAALSRAIAACRNAGVDNQFLLTAVNQLLEEQTRISRLAGDHGLSNSTIADLERERRELHNAVQSAHGGLRVLCRIRPRLASEISDSAGGRDAALKRVDRHTIKLRSTSKIENNKLTEETFRFSHVFGPDCIQAEVFNEVRGLVQSAVDGYNVLLLACGPVGAGKTFTMLGADREDRGLASRLCDELFMLRERDGWRASLDVEAQFVEIYDNKCMADVLGSNTGAIVQPSMGATMRGLPNPRAAATSSNFMATTTGGSAFHGLSAHCASNSRELRRMIVEGYSRHTYPNRVRHMVLFLNLVRTNKATGAMTRSRLVLADLAGMGRHATPEVEAAHNALDVVLRALAGNEKRIPFREHPLTLLLRDCLGGKAKAALMLALSPNMADSMDSRRAISLASCGNW